MNNYISLLLFIAGILIGMLIFDKYYNYRNPTQPESIILRDTIIEYIEREPLIIEKVKPTIIYKTDSIFITKPFVARLDTVFIKDTLFMEYSYPENDFSLYINKYRDTIIIPTTTIYTIKKDKKWVKYAAFLTGAITGYLLSK